MAGETLSLSELKTWYSAFNTVINNYSGGNIAALATPDGGTVITSDINNLYTKINQMKAETYLSTQSSLYGSGYSMTSSGQKISRSSCVPPITTTVTGIAKIKCRNLATYSNGTNTCGNHSQQCSSGTCGNGQKGNGGCSSGNCSNGDQNNGGYGGNGGNVNGTNGNGNCSSGNHNNGTRGYGSHSSGSKSNTTCSYNTKIDILNSNKTAK